MGISIERKKQLSDLANQFRIDVLTVIHNAQTGHPGGSLSVCEILTALYFEKAKIDVTNPSWPERDRVVLCKGHAAPMLYRVLAEKGFFPVEEMKSLRQLNTRLRATPLPRIPPALNCRQALWELVCLPALAWRSARNSRKSTTPFMPFWAMAN